VKAEAEDINMKGGVPTRFGPNGEIIVILILLQKFAQMMIAKSNSKKA